MRKGRENKQRTLPVSVPLTLDMLNLSKVAAAAGVNVFTLHKWRRHQKVEIVTSECEVTIRLRQSTPN